jgi:hypothetical protein
MFEYKSVIITKRGFRAPASEGGEMLVPFSVQRFAVSSQEEIDAIVALPEFQEWEYGISVGYSRI